MADRRSPHIEDEVLRALRSVAWTSEHDILKETTENGENLLHICVTGNYQRLLEFLLDHGCGDPDKQDRRDSLGRTPAQLARLMGRTTIAEMLTEGRGRPPVLDVGGSDISEQNEYAMGLTFSHVVDLWYQGSQDFSTKADRAA
jgi:ankyrin repeat protein